MKKNHWIIFFSLIFCLSANVYSQVGNRLTTELSDEEQNEAFRTITNKIDYTGTEEKWKIKKREPKERKPKDIKAPDLPSPGWNFNGGFANILAYLLILILIMVIIFMIFANVKTDKKITDKDIEDDHIEDIEAVDTLDGFKQALNAGDYRSAIRMQFIKVLQILQENNKINWKPEKTNKDYFRELNDRELKNNFRKLSSIYELVWYGNTKIDKHNFEELNPSFDKFINGFNGQ